VRAKNHSFICFISKYKYVGLFGENSLKKGQVILFAYANYKLFLSYLLTNRKGDFQKMSFHFYDSLIT
jgi:hypothetical protein